MDLEDLVYKTGPDGKPKPKRNKPLNTYITNSGTSVTASNFAAAIKAEIDAKSAIHGETAGLRGNSRYAGRIGDTKGHSKNIYQGTSRQSETLQVNKDSVVESAITQEHLNDFFQGQSLQGASDFLLLSDSDGDNYDEVLLEEENERERYHSQKHSVDDSELISSKQPSRVWSKQNRRQSFNQLEYLYRASTLSNLSKASSTPSPTRQAQKILIGRRRRKTIMSAAEKEDWKDAMSESLTRMWEIQARIEAEKVGPSFFKRMGQMLSWGGVENDSDEDGKMSGKNQFQSANLGSNDDRGDNMVSVSTKFTSASAESTTSSNPYLKKAKRNRKIKQREALDEEMATRVENRHFQDTNSPAHVRSFTSMFRLPSLFARKKS